MGTLGNVLRTESAFQIRHVIEDADSRVAESSGCSVNEKEGFQYWMKDCGLDLQRVQVGRKSMNREEVIYR